MMFHHLTVVLVGCLSTTLSVRISGKAERELYGRAPPVHGNLMLHAVHVHSTIALRFAHTRIVATVTNGKHQPDEVLFEVDMPGDAVVNELQVETNGQRSTAVLRARHALSPDRRLPVWYTRSALRDSRTLLVTAYVASNASLQLAVGYQQLLKREQSLYRHLVHVQFSDAYKPQSLEFKTLLIERQPLRFVYVPKFAPRLDRLANADLLSIPAESLAAQYPRDDRVRAVDLTVDVRAPAGVNGQFVLLYDVQRDGARLGELYVSERSFVHYLAAPDVFPQSRNRPSRHVHLALDISGSMVGPAWSQVRNAVQLLLLQLEANDEYSISLFSSIVQTRPAVRATLDNIKTTITYLATIEPEGGTSISGGLQSAFRQLSTIQDGDGIVVLITDGQSTAGITYPSELIELAEQLSADSGGVPIHAIALGRLADAELVHSLSRASRGGRFAHVLESAAADLALKNFLLQAVVPAAITDVELRYHVLNNELLENGLDAAGVQQFSERATIASHGPLSLLVGTELQITGHMDNMRASNALMPFMIHDGEPLDLFTSAELIADGWPTRFTTTRSTGNRPVNLIDRIWAHEQIRRTTDEHVNNHLIQLSIKYNLFTSGVTVQLPEPNADADSPVYLPVSIVSDEDSLHHDQVHPFDQMHPTNDSARAPRECRPTVLIDGVNTQNWPRIAEVLRANMPRPRAFTVLQSTKYKNDTKFYHICANELKCASLLYSVYVQLGVVNRPLMGLDYLMHQSSSLANVRQPVLLWTNGRDWLDEQLTTVLKYARVQRRDVYALSFDALEFGKRMQLEDAVGAAERVRDKVTDRAFAELLTTACD